MTQDLTKNSQFEEDIDLREIIKTILENKILIILFIFIFTLTSIFYSLSLKPSFKSSHLIEIGYIETHDGSQKLIETPPSLISDIKVNLVYKDYKDNLSKQVRVEALEDKLIKLNFTSDSAELNEEVLRNFFSYIDERHIRIAELTSIQKKEKILKEIDLIESEKSSRKQARKLEIANDLEAVNSQLSFFETNLFKEKKAQKLDLIFKTNNLKNKLPYIEQKINQLKEVIENDNANLMLLQSDPQLLKERTAISPTLDQIIYSYKDLIIELEIDKVTYLEQIDNLKKQLELLENNEFKPEVLFKLKQEQDNLKKQLELLENNEFKSEVLFKLQQEQDNLKKQLDETLNHQFINTSPTGEIKTKIIEPKTKPIILLGFVFGLFAGIFIVLIKNFIKKFRND
jgi:capsular polysaccharide biosynthesis protein